MPEEKFSQLGNTAKLLQCGRGEKEAQVVPLVSGKVVVVYKKL